MSLLHSAPVVHSSFIDAALTLQGSLAFAGLSVK